MNPIAINDLANFAFIQNIGGGEMLVLLIIGILLFGKRLPEVGRSLGKGIVEFKKGLRGIEDEIDESVRKSEQPKPDDRFTVESPKFEIPNSSTTASANNKPV